MDAVITADTDCETALLKINSIAGEWQWIEDEYRWFWDGTELQVNVSLQDIDRIEGTYKIAETADGNKYINFNITDEMEALGYGIVRTASGVYLSERTYNMARIAVNSGWEGTAEGAKVTLEDYLNPGSTFEYTYKTNAFDSLESAIGTLQAQAGVTDLTLITKPGSDTTIFGGGSIKGFQARFAETQSKVNNLTIGAPGDGDEIGVKWNGSLAYTGNFNIDGAKATFYVDFRGFNPEQLDTNRVYLMLDGTNATGTISGTGGGQLLFQTDDSGDSGSINIPSIQGWTIEKNDGTVYFYSNSLDKSSIAINYDWVSQPPRAAKEFNVGGKIYNYGLTAFNGEAAAKSIASTVENITYFTEEGSATTSYAVGAIKTNLDNNGFSKVAVTIKTDATMADGTFVIGDNGVTGQTQTFASLHVDEMVTGGAESKTQVDVYYDAATGETQDLFTAWKDHKQLAALELDKDRFLVTETTENANNAMWLCNADGSEHKLLWNDGFTYGMSLSPDKKKLAFHLTNVDNEFCPAGCAYAVNVYDIATGERRLIHAKVGHLMFGPEWSSDGKYLLFQDCYCDKDPAHYFSDVVIAASDGSEVRYLTENQSHYFGTAFGPADSRWGGSNCPVFLSDHEVVYTLCAEGSHPDARYCPELGNHRENAYAPEMARGGAHLVIHDFVTGKVTPLTPFKEGAWDFRVLVMPDREHIVYTHAVNGEYSSLWMVNRDGTNNHLVTYGKDGVNADYATYNQPL